MNRLVKCPRCGIDSEWEGNPHRPFCSDNCRLIDLGRWVTESYSIAPQGQEGDVPDDGTPEAEKPVE